ncbi:class I adenylate-forming enzyme family protein [Undibacter mobilis]|uniref:Long-chain fatty acid--CoA ligase n=1 Tax=Undibacter mobilis TaxID=2292256 RepID=A0A371B338_9BRAD|nr:AMP-binding protein [Undibacter mobilis]RDV01999.1 long-chain fatty acid--CoA ligase [Undibacter mobilis]
MKIDNVTYCLINNAERRPHHTAVIDGDRQIDYQMLELHVERFAGALKEQGVAAGQIVGVSMKDTIELIVIIFSLMRLGAILLPFDFRWTAAERRAVAAAFQAKLIITDTPFVPVEKTRSIVIDQAWQTAAMAAPAVTGWSTTADSPVMLSLSSGTTGTPKGPLVTHGLYMARFFYESMAVSSTQDDVNMCALPMYFGAGRNITLQHLMMGATVVMYTPPYEAAELALEINRRNVNSVFLVPTIIRRLLKLSNPEGVLFPKLRALISGAAPLYEEEVRRVRQALTPNLYVSYGTTEAGVICYLTPQHEDRKLGSVGKPAFLSDVKILDDNYNPLPQGEIGRISFDTPAVPSGFYKNPQATAESFHGGRFLPGDLGRVDEEGYVFIVGRSKDMILRAGVNIYPGDVESSILMHEAVVDAAVVGWHIGEKGEEVAAVVVVKSSVSEADLIEHCRGLIAPYKVPRRIFFADKLPRSEGGKIAKARIAALLPDKLDGKLKSEMD